jgi:hypothetical protein
MSAARRNPRGAAAVALLVGVALLAPVGDAAAHINSPDLFHEGMAGPYRLLITIRPPQVIPGVAAIEVLAPSPDLRTVTLVPIPIRGPGAVSPPLADVAVRDAHDARLYRGNLWLMATGSWQVRVHVEGPDGAGDLSVPVPALAVRTKRMQTGLGVLLLALLIFLFAGLVSIIGASVRDADRAPGATIDPRRFRRTRAAQLVTALVLAAAITAGKSWWGREAASYGQLIYKPLALAAAITAPQSASESGSGRRALALTLTDPGWLPTRHLDDLLPDHGHLMHLFAVRLPGLDAIAHLHPTEEAPGRFIQALPALPPGTYQLFADVVHANGLAETATTTLSITAGPDGPPAGDDAVGTGAPITTLAAEAPADPVATLPDGTRVVWLRDRVGAAAAPLLAGRPSWFRFRVEDRDGQPVRDLMPYMGMAGHAVFLAHDRSVFAHIHPSGSVPMAALALVAAKSDDKGNDPHAGHHMNHQALPAELAFPYACPTPGDYRIFVQVRRGDAVETGIFDARVR